MSSQPNFLEVVMQKSPVGQYKQQLFEIRNITETRALNDLFMISKLYWFQVLFTFSSIKIECLIPSSHLILPPFVYIIHI